MILTDHLAGFAAPFVIYAAVLGLHVLLPARRVSGYATRADGSPLRYRLNGLAVAVVAVAAWAVLGWTGIAPWDWLYVHRWSGLAGACALGLAYTYAIVLPVPSTGKPLLVDLFLGRLENPRHLGGRVDAKMFGYLAGAVMLELNVLSFAAHHRIAYADAPSPGVFVHAALLSFFVLDYLTFERVHLYTYDLVAERMGFKLGWGCLVFYPYFYAIGLWAAAHLAAPETSALWQVAGIALFVAGWLTSRGANLQKYRFKRDPTRVFLGIAPRTIGDGERALLCSGFWAVSRHVNYLGEILMALGLAISLGRPESPWPWLYPLYYLLLLIPRERADDRRCAAKYGALWEQYRRRVRHRIVPGLY